MEFEWNNVENKLDRSIRREKNCDICGMRKNIIGNLNCYLCGMAIHGKPDTIHEENKFLRFCCDLCLLKYVNISW